MSDSTIEYIVICRCCNDHFEVVLMREDGKMEMDGWRHTLNEAQLRAEMLSKRYNCDYHIA